jgi:hypothetical protein
MKGKEKKGKENKLRIRSHKSVKFHVVMVAEPIAISMKFRSLVHMINFINIVKFDHYWFNGLDLARV